MEETYLCPKCAELLNLEEHDIFYCCVCDKYYLGQNVLDFWHGRNYNIYNEVWK